MKREDPTSLLREIMTVCGSMNEQAVILMPPNDDDVLHGYQLHIKPLPDDMVCLRPLIEKRNLKIAQESTKNLSVIYRPINKQESLPRAESTTKQQ